MSNGRTHSLVSVIAGGIATGVSISSGLSYVDSIAIGLGCLSGILITPDHDLMESSGNVSLAVLRDDFGSIASNLWRIAWYPYARIIPHRHFISHFPVISTAIRVAYITIVPFVLMRIMQIEIAFDPMFVYWFIGLCISDTLHAIFDLF
jgi:uncharacterized metal-binding protein